NHAISIVAAPIRSGFPPLASANIPMASIIVMPMYSDMKLNMKNPLRRERRGYHVTKVLETHPTPGVSLIKFTQPADGPSGGHPTHPAWPPDPQRKRHSPCGDDPWPTHCDWRRWLGARR